MAASTKVGSQGDDEKKSQDDSGKKVVADCLASIKDFKYPTEGETEKFMAQYRQAFLPRKPMVTKTKLDGLTSIPTGVQNIINLLTLNNTGSVNWTGMGRRPDPNAPGGYGPVSFVRQLTSQTYNRSITTNPAYGSEANAQYLVGCQVGYSSRMVDSEGNPSGTVIDASTAWLFIIRY